MKKLILMVIVFLITGMYVVPVMSADVPLTVTVPDAYVERALNALVLIGDKDIKISVYMAGHPYQLGEKTFYFSVKEDTETQQEYAQRFLRAYFLNMIKLTEFAVDKVRLQTEVDALTPVTIDVPDEMIN